AGLSVTRILAPVFWVGLVVSALMFVLQDQVLPDANQKRFRIQEPGSNMFDGSDPKERAHFLYTAADGTLLYFQHYSGQQRSGTMVTALRLENGAPVLRVDARHLEWTDSLGWQFRQGTLREFESDSVAATAFETHAL